MIEPKLEAAIDSAETRTECQPLAREVLLIEYLLSPSAIGREGTAIVEHLLKADGALRARKVKLEERIHEGLRRPLAPRVRRKISLPDP